MKIVSKFVIAALAMALTALVLVACAAPPAEQTKASSPEIVVEPMKGLPGAEVTIAGSGFKPGEQVDLILMLDGDTPNLMGTRNAKGFVVANPDGALMATGFIPALPISGVYSLKAVGSQGSLATAPLVILKEAPKK